MSYVIRDAVPADLPAIREIYNDAVLNTLAIWNEQTVDLDNRQQWFNARQAQGYPILVIVDAANTPLGYASFGDWRPFEGFRHTVEHSVYVHQDHRGRGLGREIMQALIAAARQRDVHAMVGGIDASNAGSIALHERLGFRHVGTLPQVGFKFGRWLDLAFYQLLLDGPPHPVDG